MKVLQIADISFLTAKPVEKVNLATMRKHRKKLMEISKMSVTRCFDELDAYQLGVIEDNGKAGRYFR